jgi:hypothetical protein
MSGNKDAAARASVDLLELSRLAWEARKDGARVLMSTCGAHFGQVHACCAVDQLLQVVHCQLPMELECLHSRVVCCKSCSSVIGV